MFKYMVTKELLLQYICAQNEVQPYSTCLFLLQKCPKITRALHKREYLMIIFLISHQNHML